MAYEDENYENELALDTDIENKNEEDSSQEENFDTTQAEFEVYSLITDISELYGSLYEEVSTKIDLEAEENEKLVKVWGEFDSSLALSTIFMMETTKTIRELLNNDVNKIQETLVTIIENTNKALDDIDPVEPEAPEEYFETDDEEFVYN